MNTGDWYVTAAIVVICIVAGWLAGRSNPVGTGVIIARLARGENRFAALEEKVANTATKAELGVLAGQVRSLEEHAASSGEVAALSMEVKGVVASGRRTEAGIERIERILIEKALK